MGVGLAVAIGQRARERIEGSEGSGELWTEQRLLVELVRRMVGWERGTM